MILYVYKHVWYLCMYVNMCAYIYIYMYMCISTHMKILLFGCQGSLALVKRKVVKNKF